MQKAAEIDDLISHLAQRYFEKGYSKQWKEEKQKVTEMLEAIQESPLFNFDVDEARSVGSSGIVFKITDRNLQIERALKIPRPTGGEVAFTSRIVEKEIEKLTRLNHQNIVKVYYIDSASVSSSEKFPYFVMEYIHDAKGLEKYVLTNRISLDDLGKLLIQIIEGLNYLHMNDIVHCDIKPENILIQRLNTATPRVIPLISDLGYAKYKNDSNEKVLVRSTYDYAAPVLRKAFIGAPSRDAVVSEVPAKKVDFKLDLFSLGLVILKLLDILQRRKQGSDEYKTKYLRLIGARLLSWIPEDDQLPQSIIGTKWFKTNRQIIRGLLSSELLELRYKRTNEALVDTRRLLDEYNLSESIPELNPLYPNLVQQPGRTKVPFTPRLRRIVEHSWFSRLSNISQLGLAKLVYPGASHTRAEHALGTFANTCRYVAALYHNKTDPLFKSIMREKDLEAVLLTALLHDLGQYPLAHDLEEAYPHIFSHDKRTKELLERRTDNISKTLDKEWKATLDDVMDIMNADPSKGEGSIRARILHTIVDGPIDADRMDYLYRDSIHLGVQYGLGIDFDRFLKTITVAYAGEKTRRFSIAISDKGRITAESLAFARYAMYSAVYWQHTVRAFKAMLAYAVGRILHSRHGMKKLLKDHKRFALSKVHERAEGTVSKLDYNVVAEIQWWQAHAQEREDIVSEKVLQLVLERKPFKRLLVISYPRTRALYFDIQKLQSVRHYNRIESLRIHIQNFIRKKVSDYYNQKDRKHKRQAKDIALEEALILVDIPFKDTDEKLPYITEGGEIPDLAESIVWKSLHKNFNSSVGKIRILVHPEWHEIISSIVTKDEVFDSIQEFFRG